MILYRPLTCVCYSCIYMSYASCECGSTGATPQSLSNPAAARFITFPSCSTTRESMFPFFPSSVSLSQASSALETPRSRQSSQNCLHCQTAARAGSPTPALRCSYAVHVERNRKSRLSRDARSRTEAWLTRRQLGRRVQCIWNIGLIAYWIPGSFKLTRSWCPTSGGPHAILGR